MKAIRTHKAPQAIGPYSQAVEAGGFLFVSGAIPLDPATGALVDGGFEAQVRRVLDNLEGVLAEAGCGFAEVVKTTVFLADLGDFAALNALYAERFSGPVPPARSTIQVAALPRGARVEIEAVARIPER